MERFTIKVSAREGSGKEIAKKIRKTGEVPAIVYSKDTNVAVCIPHESLKILNSIHFSESAVIDMQILKDKKEESLPVIIKGVQYHPLTEQVMHIDFMKVSLKEKITVNVPVVLKGEPAAVKEGATLNQILHELEIEGLPLDIPEKIEVDVANLEIAHSVHVQDITVAQNLKIVTAPEETIVTLVAKVEEVEEEEVVPEEEGAPEGPEVIKEKKEEAPEQKEEEKKES